MLDRIWVDINVRLALAFLVPLHPGTRSNGDPSSSMLTFVPLSGKIGVGNNCYWFPFSTLLLMHAVTYQQFILSLATGTG